MCNLYFLDEYPQEVDYDGTMATKLAIAKKVFYLEKDEVLSSDAFQMFFQENEVNK